MRRNIIISVAIMAASVALGGGVKIDNPQARANREKDAAIKANTNTAVTFATLYADYKAAKNTSQREAVMDRILAKLAGVEAIEAEQKQKQKAKVGK